MYAARFAIATFASLVLVVVCMQSGASGDEREAGCADRNCAYGISGDELELRFGEGALACRSVTGSGQFSTTTTAITTLRLHGCSERITVFGFACTGIRDEARAVRSRPLGTHLQLDSKGRPSMNFPYVTFSFTCGGFIRLDVEGFLIGPIHASECARYSAEGLLSIEVIAHGRVGSGPLYDVYVGSRGRGYGVAPPWRVTFDRPVALPC